MIAFRPRCICGPGLIYWWVARDFGGEKNVTLTLNPKHDWVALKVDCLSYFVASSSLE
jgi:hypothetical protein